MKLDASTLRAALAVQNRTTFLNDSRKSAITLLLNEGKNVTEIAELMYDAEPQFTQKYIKERVKGYVQRLLAKSEQLIITT